MNRTFVLLLAAFSLIMSMGCSKASIEESRYVLERSSDFQTELSNSELGPNIIGDIELSWAGSTVDAKRLFIYESKFNQICYALMNSDRPPKMVFQQCYSHQCPSEGPAPEATPSPQITKPPECGCNYTVEYPARGQ